MRICEKTRELSPEMILAEGFVLTQNLGVLMLNWRTNDLRKTARIPPSD